MYTNNNTPHTIICVNEVENVHPLTPRQAVNYVITTGLVNTEQVEDFIIDREANTPLGRVEIYTCNCNHPNYHG